jgi:hypothetical protein
MTMATAFKSTESGVPFIHPDDMPDQYALKAVGDCMTPVLSSGTLIVCDKRVEPEPDDIVSLIFTQEVAERRGLPGLVKKLAMALPPWNMTGDAMGLVVVDQLNPPRRYCIPTTDLLAVHKVIGIGESCGDGMATFRPSQAAPR